MNESTTTQYYHKKLRAKGIYCLKLCLTHNSGVPDSWIVGDTGSMWIEFKYIKALPKRANTIVPDGLSALQRKWIEERIEQGVRVAVIICTPEGDVIRYGTEKALTTAKFKQRMVPRKTLVDHLAWQVQG